MVPVSFGKIYIDSTEDLIGILEFAWETLCETYDANGRLPEMPSLFDGADITTPRQAAEMVIVNMLMEVSDSISRFSPWYTKPSRAFGLHSVIDVNTNRNKWELAPEAIQKWQAIIAPLAVSIRQNTGLIQAMLLVDRLMSDPGYDEIEYVNARCGCMPPHTIKINKSILDKEEVFCNLCKQPYS